MDYEHLAKVRGRAKGSLTRAANLAQDDQVELTGQQALTRRERLEEVWQEYCKLTNQASSADDLPKDVDLDVEFQEYEEKYIMARSFFVAQEHRWAQSDIPTVAPSTQPQHNDYDLPKINIPPFSGKYMQWPSFKDLFSSAVDSKAAVTNTQKLFYLKSLLRDEAANLVRYIPVTDSAYQTAWDRLNERYNRPRQIVSEFIGSFLSLPPTRGESSTDLRRIADGANDIIRGLQAIGQSDRDCWLIHLLLAKVDQQSRRKWIEYSRDDAAPPLDTFFNFLDDRCEELELMGAPSNSAPKTQPIDRGRRQSSHLLLANAKAEACIYCNANEHSLSKCALFLGLSVAERRVVVQKKGLCFNCLKAGHNSYACTCKYRCRSCSKRHHTLVHPVQVESPESQPATSFPQVVDNPSTLPNTSWSTVANVSYPVLTTDACSSQGTIEQNSSLAILPTALVRVQNSRGQLVTCRALLDSASELSYISEQCAKTIGVSRTSSNVVVSGISAVRAETTKGKCNLHVQSRFADNSILICAHILSRITSSLPASTVSLSGFHQLQGITLADPSFHVSSPIDILIGAKYMWNVLTYERILNDKGNVLALSSIFGWIVTSAATLEHQQRTTLAFTTMIDLDSSLKRFWEIEEPFRAHALSSENALVEKHFVDTYARHADGKFIVHLPFKPDIPTFAQTLQGALSRFYAVERRLIRDKSLRDQYTNFMREYIELGHMKQLRDEELSLPASTVFYMPHHPVMGKKLRVVFDGSFQDSNGISLNSTLHIGPSIQRNLFAVSLRFRLHKFVFSADIIKMFRQIWVVGEHQDYQRIVWRENPLEPVRHYKLCTVTYGTSCAPFLSVRVLEQIGIDGASQHPLASNVLLEDFYVDDVLTGAETEEKLIKIRDELITLLADAGMKLSKWVSNSRNIMPQVLGQPDEDFLRLSDEPTKILGVFWKPVEDLLAYRVNTRQYVDVTKRLVLSDVSRIFDPLGLLAPIVIRFKILFQELWLLNLAWDDILPHNLSEYWYECKIDIENISGYTIPRFIPNTGHIELHGFSDASEKAYSAAVYCRSKDDKGKLGTSLLAAKTRVAPLKQVSLPRLELCGALLLCRLMKLVSESLSKKTFTVNAWSDSTIVISWLSVPPTKLKTFVANRTAEILETLPRDVWRHVRSEQNPADCASRGMSAANLIHYSLWWSGPTWLSDEEQYNQILLNQSVMLDKTTNIGVSEEMKPERIFTLTTTSEIPTPLATLITNCSTFKRLLRILAYVIRFVYMWHPHKKVTRTGGLTFDEIRLARIIVLRNAQQVFEKDRVKLLNKQGLHKGSKLLSLSPFLDEDGLLRVGGRIRNSRLDTDAQHPVILPKNHQITKLILDDEHKTHLHPGVSALFVIVRQKYWIFGARNLIRGLTHKCLQCFRQRQTSTQQFMADLPSVRVRQAFPFEKTGCDYAGPFWLKQYKGRNARKSKGYICLFVCMVTTAIHLELATDLSTECFLAALRRFMARRGKCSHIYSDNGRNFVGASRELTEMYAAINSKERANTVTTSLAEEGIKWTFNPPHAPHWGGIWESEVRSVKLHLKRVMGDSILTFEQMHTLLAQIEAVVNSRPIGVTSDGDTNYLSPSHFLLGRPHASLPETDLSNVPVNKMEYWQHIQNMYRGFWRRWHREYLTSLQQRLKWCRIQPNIQVGDMVIVKEANQPPAIWPMARVTEVYPGDDGLVRVAKVQTARGELTRPITRLAVLPRF